jgi:hypothetical protein
VLQCVEVIYEIWMTDLGQSSDPNAELEGWSTTGYDRPSLCSGALGRPAL